MTPEEIIAIGPGAIQSYQKALKVGTVDIYRASIKIVGQDRSGKTSLKKSLCGIPFNPSEESTDGLEVSLARLVAKDGKNHWETKLNDGVIAEDIAKVIARDLTDQVARRCFALLLIVLKGV